MEDCKVISRLTVRDKVFHIIAFKHDGAKLYAAIDNAYITDGKINRPLNGVQMHTSSDLNQCIEYARTTTEFDHYIAQGLKKSQAFEKVFNVQLTDQARAIFDEEEAAALS